MVSTGKRYSCVGVKMFFKKNPAELSSAGFYPKDKSNQLFFAETSFIGNDLPGLFFTDGGWDQGNHPCAGAAILNDPHEFAIFPFLVKFAIGKIPWTRV